MDNVNTIKERWTELDAKRKGILQTARYCSTLTLPSLLPPDGWTGNDELPVPYQGLGARAVLNLASKLLLTLLPPNSPFFKLGLDHKMIEELKAALGEEGIKTSIESKLAQVERIVTQYIEQSAIRVTMFRVLKLLIVTGNCLLEIQGDEDSARAYRMDQYVVRRQSTGKPIEIIIRENIDISELPEKYHSDIEGSEDGTDTDELYTRLVLKDSMWEVTQECCGVDVTEGEGSYSEDNCPYIPLTWNRNDGEDWGTGHVGDHIGDFNSYEGLRKALTQGALAAARLLFLVNPNGMTRTKKLQSTPNGGFASGRREDVEALQVDKHADFSVAKSEADGIAQMLASSFLLTQSIQRNAERVTAEEIRIMAQELEDSLGGIYSVLSLELQLPLVKVLMSTLTEKGELPAMPPTVKPTITTGFEALGRGHDLQKLRTFLEYLSPLGPEVINERIDVGNYASRLGTGLGLDTDGLVRSNEQVAQEQQQKQQMAMLQQGMQGALPNLTKGVMDNVNNAQQQPQQPEG